MADVSDFIKAIQLIEQSQNVLIVTHTKPDGDACGCAAVMCEILRDQGKKVRLLMLSSVPDWYAFLFEEKVPVLGEDVSIEQLRQGQFGQFDLVLIVDTNSRSQLEKFEQYLKGSDTPVLVIDHHATSDSLGTVEIVDSKAAAAGVVILDLLKYAGWPVTEKIAQGLFVAVATDTGWFQFSNTDSRVYRACAELIDAGAKPTELYDKLYHTFSPARFKLMARMLSTVELHLDGCYAVQQLTQADFDRTGAVYGDTENLINECHRIGTVKVSALFIELKDGRIRCSLRSRCAVDVSQIAAKFGGGGHKQAAGTYLPGPIEKAKKIIYDEVARRMMES